MMYGLSELKDSVWITENSVECPVKNCKKLVERQKKVFRRLPEFRCNEHNIYISPSTFEYEDKLENILWKEKTDKELLKRIFGTKRETKRISRDNSEDALTWNVFRYLEKASLLQGFLSNHACATVENSEVIYWSYSQQEKNTWSELQQARENFETNPAKGSEPDLIIKTSKALFFIEAKLNATNITVPTSTDRAVQEKYENRGDGWYNNVFTSNFETVAFVNRQYELLRFWLLGSRIAKRLDLDFFLINLVRSEKEKDIEALFKSHIKETPERVFLRVTWEDIYHFISKNALHCIEKEKVIGYFKNKTSGYNKNGHLQKAFAV